MADRACFSTHARLTFVLARRRTGDKLSFRSEIRDRIGSVLLCYFATLKSQVIIGTESASPIPDR